MKAANALCYDVAVIGGGVSGSVAAIAAARHGARTLLVEREEFLGGVAVSGLGILGFKDRTGETVIGGIAQELIDRLEELSGTLGHNYCPMLNSLTPVNAALLRLVLFEMCDESGVHFLLGCTPVAVKKVGAVLAGVTLYGGAKRFDCTAKVFIDATGDGDLCYLAGLPYEKGEKKSGELQPPSLIFAVSNVCKEKLLRYVEQNPSELDSPEGYEVHTSASFFRTVRGYNLLGLNSLIARARRHGDYADIPRDRFSLITHPNDDTAVINNTRLINFDGTDIRQFGKGIGEACRQIEEVLEFMRKYIPGCENCTLSFIAPTLGIRETRRFIGRQTLTEQDVCAGLVPPDTVALCGYNMDVHHGQDQGSELYIVEQAYGIPYGCMVPLKTEGLLFTGRSISADRMAFGSARIMSTCMALGQAAGTAAALCVQLNRPVGDVPIEKLRSILEDDGAVLNVGVHRMGENKNDGISAI